MSLADRKECLRLIKEAEDGGARRSAACEILEIDIRTVQRWEINPEIGDQRAGPKTPPAHSLMEEEKKEILLVANSEGYRDLSPWQIVALMADKGEYLASESSFYRVLKENKMLAHRSKSLPKQHKRPDELVARGPNEVWSWDITYLKGPVSGMYFYLYLFIDVFSRMAVAWEIQESEDADHASRLVRKACMEQGIPRGQVTLHSDNGGPMKGATMLATLQFLGIVPSLSRPSVSDDNPFSEALFKTLKYRPSYPNGAFASMEEAREWVRRFVEWYNTEHLHSGIRFVTPESRHYGKDLSILEKRTEVYRLAKAKNPLRWSGKTRNWGQITEVFLNPRKEGKTVKEMLANKIA